MRLYKAVKIWEQWMKIFIDNDLVLLSDDTNFFRQKNISKVPYIEEWKFEGVIEFILLLEYKINEYIQYT